MAGANGSFTYQGFSTTLYQTAVHEFGHALGLGHSTNVNSIMYATLGPANPDLNANDITGMRALYGTSPTTTPVAATSLPAEGAPSTESTLAFQMSGDAWHGDAQCIISVDGRQLGGVQTIGASHALGQSKRMSFLVKLGAGPHMASVEMVRAGSAGRSGLERQLYVEAIEFNGAQLARPMAVLQGSGRQDFALEPGRTPALGIMSGSDYTLGTAVPVLYDAYTSATNH